MRALLLLLPPLAAGWVLQVPVPEGEDAPDDEYYYQGKTWSEPSDFPLDRAALRWGLPPDAFSEEGLASSITWATSADFCEKLLPMFPEYDSPFASRFITCEDLAEAMGLAFSAWSINHRKISFTDVTARCDDWTDAEPNCPHAELWITPRAEKRDVVAQVFQSLDTLNTDPYTTAGARIAPGRGLEHSRAELSAAGDVCWYLDSTFCDAFNEYSEGGSDVQMVIVSVFIVTYVIAGVYFLFIMYQLVRAMAFPDHRIVHLYDFGSVGAPPRDVVEHRPAWLAEDEPQQGRNSDGLLATTAVLNTVPSAERAARCNSSLPSFAEQSGSYSSEGMRAQSPPPSPPASDVEAATTQQIVEEEEARLEEIGRRYPRLHAFFRWLAQLQMCLVYLCLTVLVFWPVFYHYIFLPCWECYDFTATVAHVAGQVLGFEAPDEFEGMNLKASAPMGPDTCALPLQHVELEPLGDGVDSIMSSIKIHRSRVCLSDDDLEGLNFLYPSCGGDDDASAPTTTPLCVEPPRDAGWIRLLALFAVIFCPISFVVLVLQAVASAHLRGRFKDLRIRWRSLRRRMRHGREDAYRAEEGAGTDLAARQPSRRASSGLDGGSTGSRGRGSCKWTSMDNLFQKQMAPKASEGGAAGTIFGTAAPSAGTEPSLSSSIAGPLPSVPALAEAESSSSMRF